MKRLMLSVSMFAAVGLMVAGCGTAQNSSSGGSGGSGASNSASSNSTGSGSSSSAPWATVSVGLALSPPKAVFFAPYVAQAEGFFAKEHLKVKFISMPNGLQTELGTTAGSIQFGFSSATDAIESAAANAPIHAIWSYATKLDTVCISAPSVPSAKDLVGKPVGSTGTDGFSYTLLNACLAPAGVSPSQVKPVNMQRSEFVPALVSNHIYAAVFHADDAYTVLHAKAGLHVLSDEYKAVPQWWYGGVTVKDSYAQSHKDVVERFLTAMVLADRWMYQPANKQQLIDIGVKASGEDKAAVTYAVNFIIQGHLWPVNSGLSQSQEEFTAQQLKKFNEIKAVPSYSSVVDTTYIDEVLKKLGTQPGS